MQMTKTNEPNALYFLITMIQFKTSILQYCIIIYIFMQCICNLDTT